MLHAINVRAEQRLAETLHLVRLRRDRAKRALNLVEHEFVFYQPRERSHGAYLGVGLLAGVTPEDDSPFCVLEFDDVRLFSPPLKVEQVHDFDPDSKPRWHDFTQPIRAISSSAESHLREILGESFGLSEAAGFPDYRRASRSFLIRNPKLRYDVFDTYGTRCVFSGTVFRGLKQGRITTQVGHLVPLRKGGPDELTNALPMSPIANWLWDEGIISLDNAGKILISKDACADTRAFVQSRTSIPFKDPRTWPRAECLSWHRDNIFSKGPSAITNWAVS